MAEAAADASGPWEDIPLGDSLYGELFAPFGGGAVEGMSVTVNGAGTAFVVSAGYVVWRGRVAQVTASKTIAPSTPPGSGTRIDRVVVRFNRTAKTAVVRTLDGSSSLGPSLSATDDVFDVPLARATIKSGAPQVSAIVDERRPAPDGVIPKSDISAMNIQGLRAGQMAVSPTIGWLRYFDGSLFRVPRLHSRTSYSPVWTMQNSAGTKRGSFLRLDQDLCWAEGSIIAGTGASLGLGQITVSLPFPVGPSLGSGSMKISGEAWWSRGSGPVKRLLILAGANQSTAGIYMANSAGEHIQPGDAGLSWIPGDVITFNLTYPVNPES